MNRIRPRTKPRKGRVRDQAYLDWLHTQPSIVSSHDDNCLCQCPITAHHVRRFGGPKNDQRAVPLWLCRHLYSCGDETVEHGKTAFEQRFGIVLEQEIVRLCGAYKEYQSKQQGCTLPKDHDGNHTGNDLDLIPVERDEA